MIIIHCSRACAHLASPPELLTAGMAKAVTVEFEFTEDWDNLTKTAVFTDGKTTIDVLQSRWQGSTVAIPAEVLTTAGRYVRVGVYGSNADGVALPTIWAELGKVRPGADPSGDESTDPSLPVWAQLQELIGDLDDLTTKAKNTLVAAINEAAKTGSGGSGSIDLRVADGYIQYSNDGGATWENLIALADLKGEDGTPGTPGKDGKDGTNGQDGYSPSASVSETDTGATITITDKTGTTTAEIKNGKDGKDGTDGAPGKDGTNGKDGSPGAKGDPGLNLISAETATQLAGLLKGNGATVETAIPGTDYLAEPELFVCTITDNVCDRTPSEIQAAARAGKLVIAYVGSIMLSLFRASSIEALFAQIAGTAILQYKVVSDKSVAVTNTVLQQRKLITDLATSKDDNTSYPSAKAVYDAIPHPETKSDAQTQPVGVDADGKLWTQPGGGSSGGGDAWELINSFEVSEENAARVIAIDKDSNGAAFSLKRFAFYAKTNSTDTGNSNYGWFCVNGRGNYNSGVAGFQTNYVRHPSSGAAIENSVSAYAEAFGMFYENSTGRKATNDMTRNVTEFHEVEFAGYGSAENLLYGTFELWGIRK